MQRTFYLDVKDAVRTINHRFEVRFADDEEVIRHSQELAVQLRHRHYPNSPGTIEVRDHVNRKIHEEPVYPSHDPLHEP